MRIDNTHAADSEALREQYFKKADQDGNGTLSKEELRTSVTDPQGRSVRSDGTRTDIADGTGATGDETDAARAQRPSDASRSQQFTKKAFDKADVDRDGLLSLSELLASVPDPDKTQEAIKSLYDQADTEGDGAAQDADLEVALAVARDEAAAYGPSGAITMAPPSRLSRKA